MSDTFITGMDETAAREPTARRVQHPRLKVVFELNIPRADSAFNERPCAALFANRQIGQT